MENMTPSTEAPKPNPLAVKFPDLKESLDKIEWGSMSFESVPQGKNVFAVMGEVGDTKHIWTKSNPDEVDAMRDLYKKLTKKGYRAYRVTGKDGEKGELMTEFDPEAERVIFAPQMQGG